MTEFTPSADNHRLMHHVMLSCLGVFLLTVAGISWSASTSMPQAVRAAINGYYDDYLPDQHCWLLVSDNMNYCMAVSRIDTFTAHDGKRIYVLLSGHGIHDDGSAWYSHVLQGRVGAFVFALKHGKPTPLAVNPDIHVGAFNHAPEHWQWVALGPSGYRGWISTWGDAHQGYSGLRETILAPYGHGVRELAGFPIAYSDVNACGLAISDCKDGSTDLSSHVDIDSRSSSTHVDIDSRSSSTRVYPLRISIDGQYRGKAYDKTFTFPFDTGSWSYRVPADWPLAHVDY